MVKKTVLVADDQLWIMGTVIDKLKKTYKIETVTNGNDAVDRIEKGGLDLIILDNSMPPGPSGSYIAQQVINNHPDIYVVLQSGDPDELRGLEELGIKVLDKFDKQEIIKYVKDTLKK